MLLLDYSTRNKVKKFIYASTGGVYNKANEKINENQSLDLSTFHSNFYALSKVTCESMIMNYSKYLETCVILRPFFIYGENQNKGMFIPGLIEKIKNGNSMFIEGKEGIKINPIYVNDFCRVLVACLNIEGTELFNVAGHETISIRKMIEIISQRMKQTPNISVIEPLNPMNLLADISKIDRFFNLSKTFSSFEDNIDSVIRSYA
jgi:UDP-glucose 4-epimerase